MKATTLIEVGAILCAFGFIVAPRLSGWNYANLLFEIPGGICIVVGLVRLGKALKEEKSKRELETRHRNA